MFGFVLRLFFMGLIRIDSINSESGLELAYGLPSHSTFPSQIGEISMWDGGKQSILGLLFSSFSRPPPTTTSFEPH